LLRQIVLVAPGPVRLPRANYALSSVAWQLRGRVRRAADV
jgi:hypothetical protein